MMGFMQKRKQNQLLDKKFKKYLTQKQQIVNNCLKSLIKFDNNNSSMKELNDAMSYALFSEGKRLRPILAIAICEAVDGEIEDILVPACCIELFHTCSIMLDDLPSMDNTHYRRGKPATHTVFGTSTTILAAVSLAAKGFEILSQHLNNKKISPQLMSVIIEMTAKMIGSCGTSGGQFLDLQKSKLTEEELKEIHIKKTSSLFYLAGLIGSELGGANKEEKSRIIEYVRHIGLLFQLVDDYLDSKSESHCNFVNIFGKDKVRTLIKNEKEQALNETHIFNGTRKILQDLVYYITLRAGKWALNA
jgi:geranylgeranyl diphosphate synthase type II